MAELFFARGMVVLLCAWRAGRVEPILGFCKVYVKGAAEEGTLRLARIFPAQPGILLGSRYFHESGMPSPKQIIVVGGGLAGMACAVALAGRGLSVTLLESRHALGGRAGSFEDPDSGELLDNCQHVLLGCCTNLLDLYRRLGAADKIEFHRTVHFLDPRGRRHDLSGMNWLPAPLHLSLSIALFSALNFKERLAVVRAMRAMLKLGKAGRDALETTSFGDWLQGLRQPEGLFAKFYDPVLISALNERTRDASAKYAIQVFQDAMLANRAGYVVGLPACPLGELYAKLPAGVNVRLSTRVDEILFDADSAGPPRAIGVKVRGEAAALPADAVVLASNHHAVQRWIAALPEAARAADSRFAGLEKLESVPILGAHLWFDRPILREPAVALIEGPLQWLFRKDGEGKALHGVISAAREWVNVPREKALAQFETQVRTLFPAARDAKLLRGVTVIEKRATFSPAPGVDALRPPQAPPPGGVGALYLAGDYTRTDWPATMEGAVRSGYLAAEGVLHGFAFDPHPRMLLADLPIEWPARFAGL
jgi:zeta-carotene desaturase